MEDEQVKDHSLEDPRVGTSVGARAHYHHSLALQNGVVPPSSSLGVGDHRREATLYTRPP